MHGSAMTNVRGQGGLQRRAHALPGRGRQDPSRGRQRHRSGTGARVTAQLTKWVVDELLTEADVPCPDWCRLAPGHDWDSCGEDGGVERWHSGPSFGQIDISGAELATRPGGYRFLVRSPEYEANVTGDELVALA